MTRKITKSEKRRMKNPIIQFLNYIGLSFKIMRIVAGGHGGTK